MSIMVIGGILLIILFIVILGAIIVGLDKKDEE